MAINYNFSDLCILIAAHWFWYDANFTVNNVYGHLFYKITYIHITIYMLLFLSVDNLRANKVKPSYFMKWIADIKRYLINFHENEPQLLETFATKYKIASAYVSNWKSWDKNKVTILLDNANDAGLNEYDIYCYLSYSNRVLISNSYNLCFHYR